MVALGHDPRVRQRMIDHRHFVVEDARIRFVEKNPLPDDCQIVLVQGNAAVIVSATGARTTVAGSPATPWSG
jgi:hypothetical protein